MEGELAKKIEYMINHPEERQRMGNNARKLVEKKYTLKIQAEQYIKIYEELLKEHINAKKN